MTQRSLQRAYLHCKTVAADHYENFPVASRLLPARLRRPISVIYSFARRADDWADEGNYTAAERLQALNLMAQALTTRECDDNLFIALYSTIDQFALPLEPFFDLIAAFRQDVTMSRYPNQEALLNYCRLSANPIGRLLLHLNQSSHEVNIAASDALCTALQLINFHQDIGEDYHQRGRIYLPESELLKWQVDEAVFAERQNHPGLCQLLDAQLDYIESLLTQAAVLVPRLKGRFGVEMGLIEGAAWRLVKKLRQQPHPFSRPRLRRHELLPILAGTLWRRFIPR
ncbi:MAG: squalene synthase HpnC [Gammaproteobacteria bacterium]|nr:squalene synthase HpnC [Gammaproteobacteria bacterium]